jgi:hypothetical protein
MPEISIEAWRKDNNKVKPLSSLKGNTRVEYAGIVEEF